MMKDAIKIIPLIFLMGLSIGCGSRTTEEKSKTEMPISVDITPVEKTPAFQQKNGGESSTAEKTATGVGEKAVTEKEIYQKLDPAELYIMFEAQLTQLWVDSGGNLRTVEGVVKTITVGETKIELASDKITMEGSDAFIATKEYGKIKVTFDSNALSTLWLTPSQKQKLLKLKE